MKIALTIAGSDSGGGAGIQADLKTFSRFGLFGTSVITAVTAQNTMGVVAWEAISAGLVRSQIDAVLHDLPPDAIKSGMLGTAAVVDSVADALREQNGCTYVLDPVMVATSGDVLLDPGAVASIRKSLLPIATLVTPNTHEAALLTGRQVTTVAEMRDAARCLVEEHGAAAALVKGGHLGSVELTDVLLAGEISEFRRARIATRNTHGTGCTLSAAIAANMALGAGLFAAVEVGLDYVHRAILLAPGLGSAEGAGPLNHFAR